jgi:hypothetical protein
MATDQGSGVARTYPVEERQVEVRMSEEWQIFALSPHTVEFRAMLSRP